MEESVSEYDAPNVLRIVGSLLSLPRREYARDFALVVTSSPDSTLQKSYRSGLIFTACLIAGLVFIWGFILVWLKLQGRSAGCAAGFAFEMNPGRRRKETNEASETSSCDDADDPLWEDSQTQNPAFLREHHRIDTNDDALSGEMGLSPGAQVNYDEEGVDETLVAKPLPRERRARVCFFFFGLTALVCVPLILIYAFKPIVDASAKSDGFIQDARDVINETSAALATIALASEGSLNVVMGMTLDMGVLCPNFTSAEVEGALGVDLASMLELLNNDYVSLAYQVSGNVSDVGEVLQYAEDALLLVERSIDETENYLWLVPTILFMMGLTTALVLAGSCFSRKRQSSQRFQHFLSYGMLPLLIALSLSCWLIAMVSAGLTAVSSDACLSGSSSGSPDETIVAVLNADNIDPSSILYKFIVAYTTGCHEDNPAAFISSLESKVQAIVDFIWQGLSNVDAVGQDNLAEYCGASDELDIFLAGSRDLAKLLSSIREALDTASKAFSCKRINTLYEDAVHEVMCTDVTSAVAWGFVLCLCAGIATMGMISLRSSWRHKIGEDKIYDESEVAENMIVDEHEEYLIYIGKYKHEWDEYLGVSAISQPPIHGGSTDSLDNSTSTDPEGTNGLPPTVPSSICDDFTAASAVFSLELNRIELLESGEDTFDPYNSTDTQSQATSVSRGSISFVSLGDAASTENKHSSAPSTHRGVRPPLLRQRYEDQ